MKKRHLRSVIVLAASCFTAQAALAQEAPVAPAPPPSDGRTTQAPAGNPAVQRDKGPRRARSTRP